MSLHEDAVRVLNEYADQAGLRREYLDHLGAYEDALWKACGSGHLTASALVVAPERRQVLLTLHKKQRMWLQMGGHCEPEDASLRGAALREAAEESGITGLALLPGGPVRLDKHSIAGPCRRHFDVQYAAAAPAGAVERISDESLDLRWYGYDEVADVADESVVRLLERTRERLAQQV